MNYETTNKIKSCFDDVYHGPTPHGYFNEMHRLGYEISEQAKPYFRAGAEFLSRQLGPDQNVRILDLGCSYGVGAALLKYDCTFSELADFFSDAASKKYQKCIEETRELLSSKDPIPDIECAGADASKEAIRFATATGLIQDGITNNLENGDRLNDDDTALLRSCNLLASTGAIGYVGEKTLTPILEQLGRGLRLTHGPYSIVTILRMFDPTPIVSTFAESGYRFVRVPGVRLRQRRFDGKQEFEKTVKLLRAGGINPEGWESEGFLYADLFAAAPEKDLDGLVGCLCDVKSTLDEAPTGNASTDLQPM